MHTTYFSKLSFFSYIGLGCLALLSMTSTALAENAAQKEYYELRQYIGIDPQRIGELDDYLEKALLPAMQRQGVGPIGVLAEAAPADKTSVYLLIPFQSIDQFTQVNDKLATDSQYQKDAAAYLATAATAPVFERVKSELSYAFDCMPKLAVPTQKAENKPRLFELRTYESATEQKGLLKVEMFNSGEVPIFLDCGIQPVFFGQALIGDKLPNLTYMTVYDDSESRDAGWVKFREHPDWKVLSKVDKYQQTVSKIYKTDLLPRPYSQL